MIKHSSNQFKVLAVVSAVTMLVACGGGGGGTTPSTSTTTPTVDINQIGNLITVLPASTYRAGTRDAELFAELNAARGPDFGYLMQSPELDKAATAHALYIQTAWSVPIIDPDGNHYSENGVFMYQNGNPGYSTLDAKGVIGAHTETPGRLNFTGYGPNDRANAAGYSGGKTNGTGEVIATEGLRFKLNNPCIGQLLASVFHRDELMGPFMVDVGIGTSALATFTTRTCVINFGVASTKRILPENWSAVYPRDGATNVATRMWVAEVPNPAPEFAVLGMPVSFYGTPGKRYTFTDFKLTGPSGTVKTKLLTSYTNKDGISPWNAVVVPDGSLSGDAKYTAEVTGTVDGANFKKAWSFTTTVAGDAGRF